MQEREKEISVHKDVLIAEKKSAEDERHNIGVELSSRRTKVLIINLYSQVKNLKIKYESLVAKNQANSGEGVGEHSQAYYIIKASQEREEL